MQSTNLILKNLKYRSN